jgi:hypothetical protein
MTSRRTNLNRVEEVVVLKDHCTLSKLLLRTIKVKVDVQALEEVRDGVSVPAVRATEMSRAPMDPCRSNGFTWLLGCARVQGRL